MSSHDQRDDLDRQVARLSEWATRAGAAVVRVETEVESGMNGARRNVRRLLADPLVATVVVEHRDRLGRMNTELVEAALSAHGRPLVRNVNLNWPRRDGSIWSHPAALATWSCLGVRRARCSLPR
ncbi:MAG: recombinase family protein [Mycobacterium sp.]